LACAKIHIQGLVMIGHRNKDNERSIEHFGAVPVIGTIPWLDIIDREALLTVYRSSFDRKYFGDAD
jgi:hypothetical protein